MDRDRPSKRIRAGNPLKGILTVFAILILAGGVGGVYMWYTNRQAEMQQTADASATSAAQTATNQVAAAATSEAQAAITATAEAEMADIEQRYQAAVGLQEAGSLTPARVAFQELIILAPGYKDVAQRLKQINDALAEAYYQQGVASAGQKLWSDAVTAFDMVLEIAPNYKDTVTRRAEALRELNATPTPRPVPTTTPQPTIAPTTPADGTPTQDVTGTATTEGEATTPVPQAASITTPAVPLTLDALPVCPETLIYGQMIRCDIRVASEIDDYSFEGNVDDRLTIRMHRASETIQPWVRVFAPDGAQICEAYAERFIEMLPCGLPRSGTYTIKVSDASRDRAETGNYTLYIQRLNNPNNAQIIEYGETVQHSIGVATQIDTYRFNGNVDDRIFIRMGRISETVHPWVRIFAPNGDKFCEGYDERFIDQLLCTLPRTGSYTILIGDASGGRTEIGDYRMYIQRLNGPGNAKMITIGETISDTIAIPADIKIYTFEAKADDIIALRVTRTSETLQPWVRVLEPTGNQVCDGHNERIVDMQRCVLPRSGIYSIIVTDASRGRAETGSYTLSLGRP